MNLSSESPREAKEVGKRETSGWSEEPPVAPEEGKLESMEDLLMAAGTTGWWNFTIFACCAWGSFVSPMHILSYQYLGATPDYWCQVPELIEANWTQEQIISLSVPNTTNKIRACEMVDLNYTRAVQLGFKQTLEVLRRNATGAVLCNSRSFDQSESETTVTMWDLVCERRALYSTTQSAVQAGKLIGSLIIGFIINLGGRRKVFLWCAGLYLLTGLVTVFSPNVEVYIALKMLISCIAMAFYLGGLVLALELCSTSQRSYIGPLFAVPWALGYMILPGIAYNIRSFKFLQIAVTLPVLTLIPHFWILPESPRWLVSKGRIDEAMKVLEAIAKRNNSQLPPKREMKHLMEKISKESKEDAEGGVSFRAGLRKLFELWLRRRWRCILPIITFGWFSVSLVYYGTALDPTTFDNLWSDKYFYMFLGGLLEVPAYLLLWPAIKYFGRRKSLMMLYFLCTIAIFGSLMIIIEGKKDSYKEVKIFKGWELSMFLLKKVAITAAFQLLWVYTAELVPTDFRSIVVGEANVFASAGSVCSPYIVDILQEYYAWAPSSIFGAVSLVAGFFFIFLPETKNSKLSDTSQESRPSSSQPKPEKNTLTTKL